MNGRIPTGVAALALLACVTTLTGCDACGYYDTVDPCYPERYNFAARKAVCDCLTPQVKNGHILDQTVWNWHFDPGTDTLNPAGQDHLLYLIRRRPCPDPVLYLATAQDITYQASNPPEEFAKLRTDLDAW
jgi:hypothetical protein